MAEDFAKKLGLTDYEMKAYLALVKHGQLKGGEAAEKAGIPNAKVYGTLRSLVEKNLAVMVKEKPMAFKGVEPEKAIAALVDEKKAGIENAAIAALGFFSSQPRQKETEETVGNVELNVGYEQRMRTSWNFHKTAKKYYYMISPVNFRLPMYVLKARAEAIKRGVDEKFIVSKLTEENRNEIKKYSQLMEMRFLEDPNFENLTFYVWDDKKFIVILSNTADKSKALTLTIDSSDLAKAMKKYFLELYKKAKAIKSDELR